MSGPTYPLSVIQVNALRYVDRDFRAAAEARRAVVQALLEELGLNPTDVIDVDLERGVATLRPEPPKEA